MNPHIETLKEIRRLSERDLKQAQELERKEGQSEDWYRDSKKYRERCKREIDALTAAIADMERLDSGRILIRRPSDECGLTGTEHVGIDLRKAIDDAAMKGGE